LHDLKNGSGNNTGNKAGGKANPGIRNKNIKKGEKKPHQHIGQKLQQKEDERTETSQDGKFFQNDTHLRRDEYGCAAGENEQDGTNNDQSKIIAEHAADRPFFFYFPDIVERRFNLTEKFENSPHKNNQTDTGNEATLGFFQQRMGKRDDIGSDFLLTGQPASQLCFQGFFQPEAFRDTESHGGNGNDRNQSIKSQGGSAQLTFILMKTFEGKNQNPRLFDQEGFAGRKLGTANSPDVMGDEIGELSDLFHNVFHDGAPRIRLKDNFQTGR
jgi:hypothetical protein